MFEESAETIFGSSTVLSQNEVSSNSSQRCCALVGRQVSLIGLAFEYGFRGGFLVSLCYHTQIKRANLHASFVMAH